MYDFSITMAKAASRARGDRLQKFYSLCENQRSMSTTKIKRMLNEIHEGDKLDAIHFKALAEQIKEKEH